MEVYRASFGVGGDGVLDVLGGVRGVGRARVWGSVGAEVARGLEGRMMEGRRGEGDGEWRVGEGVEDLWVSGGR